MRFQRIVSKFSFFSLFQGKKSQAKATNKLMIVAEYHSENEHSDNDQDDETPQKKSEKPLFAAASSINQPILPIQINTEAINATIIVNKTETSSSPEPPPNELEKIEKPKTNSFASIITGGRSPDSENQNITELSTSDENQLIQNSVEPNSPMELDKKLFKRKRRIEFITKTTPNVSAASSTNATQLLPAAQGAIYPQPLEEICDETEQHPQNDLVEDNNTAALNGTTAYPQFHKSHVEFSSNDNDAATNAKQDKCSEEDDPKEKEEIGEVRNVIEAKIKFLCDGRPEVSAVQAIMIQMEVSDILKDFIIFIFRQGLRCDHSRKKASDRFLELKNP